MRRPEKARQKNAAFLPAEDLARETENQGALKKNASIFTCRRSCAEDRKKRRAKKIGSICTCKRPCAKTEKTVVQKLLAEKSTRIFVRTPPKILESLDPPDPPKILKNVIFDSQIWPPKKSNLTRVFEKVLP